MTNCLCSPRVRQRWGLLLAGMLGLSLVVLTVISCTGSSRRQRPSVRAKSCLDCHTDFLASLEGAQSHFPELSERCEDCHDRHGLVGVLKLKAPETTLCLQCHDSANLVGPGGTHTHGSLQEGSCSACHDPHASQHGSLLRVQGSAMCTQCHDESAFHDELVHAPVAEGCLSCHDSHGSTDPLGLSLPVPELCATCHDATVEDFVDAHGGHDVARSQCGSCHSPHTSSGAGLLRATVHEPVADLDCSLCHVEPEDVEEGETVPPMLMSSTRLCGVCHGAETAEFLARGAVHDPVGKRDCLQCHSAHASDHAGLLVVGTDRELCTGCHEPHEAGSDDPVAQALYPHAPVTEGRCLQCHDPHGGTDQRLLNQPEKELCLSCHESVQRDLERPLVHEAVEECTSCHAGHGSSVPALLTRTGPELCTSCHEDAKDRFFGIRDTVHDPVARGQCVACHDPHASDHANGLRATGPDLCFRCHQDVVKNELGGSVHSPAVKGECLTCHDPHSSPQADLLVSSHEELCASCHGLTKQAIQEHPYRHAPAETGACQTCHAAHSAPRSSLLRLAAADLCRACHGAIHREMERPGTLVHEPMLEGDCLQCHLPHSSEFEGLTRATQPDLCVACHELSKPEMRQAHLDMVERIHNCLGCHAPHSAEGEGLFWPHRHAPFMEKKCDECH